MHKLSLERTTKVHEIIEFSAQIVFIAPVIEGEQCGRCYAEAFRESINRIKARLLFVSFDSPPKVRRQLSTVTRLLNCEISSDAKVSQSLGKHFAIVFAHHVGKR